MRYFVKRNSAGEVIAFGRGGTSGEEITREEYEQLRQEAAERLEKELAERPLTESQEPIEAVSYGERIAALEAAMLEIVLGGDA